MIQLIEGLSWDLIVKNFSKIAGFLLFIYFVYSKVMDDDKGSKQLQDCQLEVKRLNELREEDFRYYRGLIHKQQQIIETDSLLDNNLK
jgi:hypothetical protein